MKEIATISFNDAETNDEALAIVRADKNRVALCLSLKTNGDVEVFLNKADGKKLLDALSRAIEE